MKKLLTIILIALTLVSCQKEEIKLPANKEADNLAIEQPTNKVGFFIDTNWLKKSYPGFWIETHRWYGYGDFNKDGLRDLVVMFATNAPANINHQKDSLSRILIGVFYNHKTYFQLDTNLVYSYLGGYNGVNVADINKDGYLDVYQKTGIWEGTTYPKPPYYNNNGLGGMDAYLFINNKNKGFTKYTIPIENDAPSTTSVICDNNMNGYAEIYSSNSVYYEFNGNKVNRYELQLQKTFNGQTYDLRVVTPKYQSEKYGVYYLASDNFTDTYFILKVIGNQLVPIVKYNVPYHMSGFTEGTGGERDEMYIEDIDKDGRLEYIIPSQIFNTSTTPCIPYLLIIDNFGNDVTSKHMDAEITRPLTYEQMNFLNINGFTGFIYHTFFDMDGDGIKEIFPASGIGYKKGNDTYYYKSINGKYRLEFYHSGWTGNVNINSRVNYWPFVDEKTGVNIFLVGEGDLLKTIFKYF